MTDRIRALIVDDEPAARDTIRLLLAGVDGIEIVGESADGRSALAAIRATAPDLVFLDVQMPELDGISMLRALDPAELPVVVFITAYDRYAVNAFEVHALDYLLKPFDDARFREAVARARERVRQARLGALSGELLALLSGPAREPGPGAGDRYLQRLAIKADGRVTLLDLKDVDWIEADGDHVKIRAGRDTHPLRDTMKHLESQLDPARFARIHRSTIVNVERIRELQPWFRGEYVVKLHDGTSLKLSRGYKPHLETLLGTSF